MESNEPNLKEREMDPGTRLKVPDERQWRALTGVTEEQREIRVKNFDELREANLAQPYEEAVARGDLAAVAKECGQAVEMRSCWCGST